MAQAHAVRGAVDPLRVLGGDDVEEMVRQRVVFWIAIVVVCGGACVCGGRIRCGRGGGGGGAAAGEPGGRRGHALAQIDRHRGEARAGQVDFLVVRDLADVGDVGEVGGDVGGEGAAEEGDRFEG